MSVVNRSNIFFRCLLALAITFGSSWAITAPASAVALSAPTMSTPCADMGFAARMQCQDCCAVVIAEQTIIRTVTAFQPVAYAAILITANGTSHAPVPPPPRSRA